MEIQKRERRESRLKRGARKASQAAAAYAAAPLPKSLEWIYGLGFKAGVFLALKSFVVLRMFHLSFTGILMAFSQMLMGFMLIILGAIMQQSGAMDNPSRLKKITRWYGLTAIVSTLFLLMEGWFSWNFFQEAAAQNWFLDFFNGLAKGTGEIFLSLVFWDAELWTAFCALLFLLSFVYLNVEQPEGRFFQHLRGRVYGSLPSTQQENELSA